MAIRRIVAAMLLLTALAAGMSACSGSGSSEGSSADGGTTTYANDEYGFTITYDALLTEGTPSGGSSSGSGSEFDIAFVDTGGTEIGGKYLEGIQLSVYELARTVERAEVPELEAEVDELVNELMGTLPDATIVDPLAGAEVNGVPGFTVSYTFSDQDVTVKAVSYFLFSGKYEYLLTGQASKENWATLSPTLEEAIASFTVQ